MNGPVKVLLPLKVNLLQNASAVLAVIPATGNGLMVTVILRWVTLPCISVTVQFTVDTPIANTPEALVPVPLRVVAPVTEKVVVDMPQLSDGVIDGIV